MKDMDFLTFLVEETFKLQRTTSLEVKLAKYRLPFIKGKVVSQLQVIRFQFPLGLVDIPMNWSIFASEGPHYLDAENDVDYLFSVLKKHWALDLKKIIFLSLDGRYYFVGVNEGDEQRLSFITDQESWSWVA